MFQLAVVAAVVAVAAWLLDNYRVNAARSSIPTNFDFLDNPASFTIPGNSFVQTQPVRDAFVQGFYNTLRIAVVGIILATILGLIVGVGRLSKNFVVRALATAYVEVFRNLPLFIVLTFCYLGLVLQVLPTIEQAWEPLGLGVLSNRGIAAPWFVGRGLGLIGLLALGALVAWGITRWRHAVFERSGTPARSGLWAGAGLVAVLVAGWVIFGYRFTIPEVDDRGTVGGIRMDPSYFALLVALVLYTASHIAEIIRGSIQAVHRGQDEAAQALAFSGFQRMWLVVLPQAMRIALPPLGNQYINLLKNSSLGAAIGYFDLTNVTQISVANSSPAVPAFALTLVVYLALSLAISFVVNVVNRRMTLVTR